MILTSRSVRATRPASFHRGRRLYPTVSSDSIANWVLTNDSVSFRFISDPSSGLRLYSWQAEGGNTVINQSKNLWSLGMINDYLVNIDRGLRSTNSYVVYPSVRNFIGPSQIPVTIAGGKQFTFTWSNVKYDYKKPSYTCTVILVAKLLDNSSALDLSLSVRANQAYTASDLLPFNTSVLSYLGYPKITIKKDDDENINKESVLGSPVTMGFTYRNPFKYLRYPRYVGESFHYLQEGTRSVSAGQPGYPGTRLNKFTYGAPGGMGIPAILLGNRGNKNGTLMYAMDVDGNNAKSFQFYFDDSNFHLNAAHPSDHEIDPYGVGGYDIPGATHSQNNTPTWSFRIRPFVAPTKWVDWYAFKLYKDEAVPEQVEHGWMPESFYERYIDGDISKEGAEIPMILNAQGMTTGTFDECINTLEFYQSLYNESINPNIVTRPLIPTHYQPRNLNYAPVRVLSGVLGTYNGWEPWAGSGLSGGLGPEAYKSPDYNSVNGNFHTGWDYMTREGCLLYAYNLFTFTISSGSAWTMDYSGLNLVGRDIFGENYPPTEEDYREWAYSGIQASLYDPSYIACPSPDENYDRHIENTRTLAYRGAGMYHDTLGVYGRGCYAISHDYIESGKPALPLVHTHPRAGYSRYFVDKQLKWVSGYAEESSYIRSFIWDKGTYPNAPTREEFKIGSSSEMPCDLHLRYVPITLLYEQLGPILKIFLNDIDNPRPDAISNYLGGSSIDDLDDLTISLALSAAPSVTHWASLIDAPNWIQACPAFNIALSDRSLQNMWTAVYATNAYGLFFGGAEITGTGTYGQLQRPGSYSEEVRAQDWAAFTAIQFPMNNRMTVWHLSNQLGFINSRFSGLDNDEYSALYSGVFSGYTEDLITRYLRVQGYNPDYVYHGTIEHPLDDFNSEYSTAPMGFRGTIYTTQTVNNYDPDVHVAGAPKTPHFVRRHRANDNLLIVVNNWHSGSAPFQGTFDPASYGITNGCQVYDLDVNSSNHGTRTLTRVLEPGETYSLNTTLDQYEFRVLEIETNSNVLESTIFNDLETSFVKVRYSYGVDEVSTSYTDVSYSYGSSVQSEVYPPLVGYRSPSTQDILNNLPYWNKMRQNYESNGWKLVNSWGMSLESVLESVISQVSDMNLLTANVDSISELSYIDVDDSQLVKNLSFRNLLFNSSFSIPDVTRTSMPAGWDKTSVSDDTRLEKKDTLVTPFSLKSSSGAIRVGQHIFLDNALIDNMTASCYIKCDADNVDIRLHVSYETINGQSKSSQTVLSSRSTQWRRLVLPISVNDNIYRINFSIYTNCSASVTFSAPQLEIGAVTDWSRSIIDVDAKNISYEPFNTVFTYSNGSASNVPVYPKSEESEFLDSNIPTRIVKVTRPLEILNEYEYSAFGRKVDQDGLVTRTEFVVLEDKIVERAISPTPWDIFGRYDLRDLRYHEELAYGTKIESSVSVTPLACAIKKNLLFVVCKETHNNDTKRIIKVVTPRTPPNGETYLESLIDFDLDLNFDKVFSINDAIDEEIYSVSFSDEYPEYLVITTTNNTKHYYKVFYDYYYFNRELNRLYFLEDYSDYNISIK